MTTNTSMFPKVVIPSGYEKQQLSIEQKRKLADAILSKNLETHTDYRSWAQALSQIGQAWLGKSMQKDADKEAGTLGDTIRQDYGNKLTGFTADEQAVADGTMTTAQMTQKYRDEPLLADALKPYQEAMQSKLNAGQRKKLVNIMIKGKMTPQMEGDDGSYVNGPEGYAPLNTNMKLENGVAIDPTQLKVGDRGPQNPNADVILDANGNMTPNPAKVAATRWGQGFGGSYTPQALPGGAPPTQASAPMSQESQLGGSGPPAALPTSGPIGPWIEQMAGMGASLRGRQRATGVPGTYHADNNARDFPTATREENIRVGQAMKAKFGPNFDVIYDSPGHHNHVHVEPGPMLGKQIRGGGTPKREAILGNKKYVIVGGKVFEDDGN